MKIKNALFLTSLWILLALLFNSFIYIWLGKEAALQFFVGYLLEKSLSIDNLFVFILTFQVFHTPRRLQAKVLAWGILGAIVMRGFLIYFGIALVNTFHFILPIFGLFLLYSALKMVLPQSEKKDLQKLKILQLAKALFSVTADYRGNKFFVREAGRLLATPLFLVLLVVESTDLIFALDSIPAIFGVTRDPFIIYTSNIFAILGLRSLFFVLSEILDLFRYLRFGIAFLLGFIGFKMVLAPYYSISLAVSLLVIVLSMTVTIILSLLFPKTDK